jgi:uncharacterized membrane protein
VAVAFVYSDAAGVTYLGTLSGKPGDQSFANGISDPGVVIGWSGNLRAGNRAFIWSSQMGLQPLEGLLTSLGATIPSGVTLTTALTISADGSTIAGVGTQGRQPITWLATLSQ